MDTEQERLAVMWEAERIALKCKTVKLDCELLLQQLEKIAELLR